VRALVLDVVVTAGLTISW